MAELSVILRNRDGMTHEVVNRDEITEARQKRAKQKSDAPIGKTPDTIEFSFNAAFAHMVQDGGATSDIPKILAEEIARKMAPEFDPAEIDIEILPKKKA